MGAIGGIFDIGGKEIDVSCLNAMRIAMSLRGKGRSNAYLGGRVGMLQSGPAPKDFQNDGEAQPAIFERRGSVYSLSFDSDSLNVGAVFEKYRIHGVDFLGRLCGGFALALYDGERRMLLLARDKKGIKPLFYRIYKGKIYYASEIKGLYAATGGGIAVSREMLSLHISAPIGVYRAVNILTDVKEVLPGECVLFTELGMSRFRYRDAEDTARLESRREKSEILIPAFDSNTQGLSEILSDALICFDYPQFDSDMPAICRLLSLAEEQGRQSLLFEDRLRRSSRAYSLERADRLGALYSVVATGVMSRENESVRLNGLLSMHRRLLAAFLSLDNEQMKLLSDIFGEKKLEMLIRRFHSTAKNIEKGTEKKDTDAEVRILGMLYQTVIWAESRELIIKSTGDELQSALSII